MFVGRKYELDKLEDLYGQKTGRLAIVYGRRRIGKSYLLKKFSENKKYLYFEGLEKEKTSNQIKNFIFHLSRQTEEPFLAKTKFSDWNEVFDYLTSKVFKNLPKTILILDEFQWMAAGQSKLINQIKAYWDQHWKAQGVMLALCGSIAHFMVKKVIRSKALYGRIDSDLLIGPLSPINIQQLEKRGGRHAIQS